MVRTLQATSRLAANRISAARISRISPTMRTGIIQRGRIQAKEQQKIVNEAEANRIISSINSGKIQNLNQIPLRFRSIINISQSDLNQINNYHAARKDADLWSEAFRQAESAVSRNRPLIIAFSSNPYAKTAYKQLRSQYSAYQDRKKGIIDIKSGKIANVKIIGNRIIDLDTKKPITLAKVTAKDFVQTLQKDLPVGEKIIYDKNYNVIGLESSALKKSIKLDKEGVNFYNKAIQKQPAKFDIISAMKPFSAKKWFASNTINNNINKAISIINPKNISGSGSFTRLIDVGNKMMQTFTFKYLNGEVISIKETGEKKTQTKEFKEEELERNKIVLPTGIRARTVAQIKKEREKINKEIWKAKINLSTNKNLNITQYYQNIAQWAGGTIAKTIIDSGFGIIDLSVALYNNPEATLSALPAALLTTIEMDLRRATSGDPFKMGDVFLEYYTFIKIGQVAGKITRLTKADKFFLGISKKLSPEYLNKLVSKNITPPISLRRAVRKTSLGLKIDKAFTIALKNTATVKQFKNYSLKVKKAQNLTNIKLRIIERKIKTVKGKVEIKVTKIQIKREYSQSLKRAKKSRKAALKKWKELSLNSPDYKNALKDVEALTDFISSVSATEFLIKYMKKGGKITTKQSKEFIEAVKKYYRKQLEATPGRKRLIELSKQDRFSSVKLIKQGKIASAKTLFNQIVKRLNKLKVVRKLNDFLNIILTGKRVVFRAIKTPGRIIKKGIKKKIRKYKNKKELQEIIKKGKKFRERYKGKKWKTQRFGNDDYLQLLEFSEEFTKTTATIKARSFIREWKKGGKKIGLGQEKQFIQNAREAALKQFKKTIEYRRLREVVRLNKPYFIELRKIGKLESATKIARKLRSKINRFSIPKRIQTLIRKGKAIKRKLSPKRIGERVRKKIDIRKRRIEGRKSIKYRMEKARPIREVTFRQLEKSSTIGQMNNFVDRLFIEIYKKQKVTMTPFNYKKIKVLLKKRLKRAIKNNDKKELLEFKKAVRVLIRNMKRPSNKPTVKIKPIVKRTRGKPKPKPKRVRTIKDFEIETPSGSYVEIRDGDTILLQEVKYATKEAQVKVEAKVEAVVKVDADLKPLAKYMTFSLAAQALAVMAKPMYKTLDLVKEADLIMVLEKDKMDYRVLTALDSALKYDVKADILAAIKAKTIPVRPRTITKLRPKEKKKKPIRIRLKPRKKITKKKKKALGYNVYIKKRKNFVKYNTKPLSLTDAKDIMSYVLDNTLARTGKIVPVGSVPSLGVIPAKASGYYRKNSKKFRVYKKKLGKRIILQFMWIEKIKYSLDSKREKKQIKKIRRKKRKPKLLKIKKTRKRKVKR